MFAKFNNNFYAFLILDTRIQRWVCRRWIVQRQRQSQCWSGKFWGIFRATARCTGKHRLIINFTVYFSIFFSTLLSAKTFLCLFLNKSNLFCLRQLKFLLSFHQLNPSMVVWRIQCMNKKRILGILLSGCCCFPSKLMYSNSRNLIFVYF